MVIGGRSALSGYGDARVTDEERVSRWLGRNDAVGWKVQEGFDNGRV